MSEMFDVVRVSVVFAVMIYASVSDIRSREVTDRCWWILGILGIGCMIYSAFAEGMRWEYVLLIIGSVMILADILSEVIDNNTVGKIFHVLMALMFLIPLMYSFDDMIVKQFFMVFVMFIVFLLMFITGIVKGGADVKCLIVLSMVFTSYPSLSGFPLIASPGPMYEMIFQFSIMVLFFAALLSMLTMFYVLSVNIRNGDRQVKKRYMGFMMSIEKARSSYVWPLQFVSDAGIVTTWKAQDPEVLNDLDAAGAENVLVTPMVPFMVPMTIAILFLTLIGNPYFLIL